MTFVKQACLAILLLTTTYSAHSQEASQEISPGGEKYAAGIQVGNQTTGLSFKYRATETITGQVTFDFAGSITSYGARGLYTFNTGPFYEIYAYGALSVFRFQATFIDDTSIGLGAGAGVEYDLRGIAPTLPPLFASVEIGAALGSFSSFRGFSVLGTGIALHYRF